MSHNLVSRGRLRNILHDKHNNKLPPANDAQGLGTHHAALLFCMVVVTVGSTQAVAPSTFLGMADCGCSQMAGAKDPSARWRRAAATRSLAS